jgi:hypothetical protein
MSAKRAQNPRCRAPTSDAQKIKLRDAQLRYISQDPRWPEHRKKLADAQLRRKFTLADEEVNQVVRLRRKGRTFDYIAEELAVCKEVLTRELRELGVDTKPVRAHRRAKRGKGQWRSFDPPDMQSRFPAPP